MSTSDHDAASAHAPTHDRYTDLYERTCALQHLLRRYRHHVVREHGPLADHSRGQGRVLALLRIQPELPARDLAYLMGIRQQSLNELLNKLEEKKLVVRGTSEEDGRVTVVRLTDKGREAMPKERVADDYFAVLTEDEQEAYAEYLDRLIGALEERLGDERPDAEAWMARARTRFGDERFERMMRFHRGSRRGAADADEADDQAPKGRGYGAGRGIHTPGKPEPTRERVTEDDESSAT